MLDDLGGYKGRQHPTIPEVFPVLRPTCSLPPYVSQRINKHLPGLAYRYF